MIFRWLTLVATAAVALQIFFFARIALTAHIKPQSTTFERTQLWQLNQSDPLRWRQQWKDSDAIADALQRAVVASEDDGFTQHHGVEWKAIRQAWRRNTQAQLDGANGVALQGGSTITQQLAKNLLLASEQTLSRKAQELVLTVALETLLDKRRILTLYLNHVEWGRGVFGAEAAAQHYFGVSAAHLTDWQAARLAVMLPNPRGFESEAQSVWLNQRTQTILRRMRATQLP